MTPTPTNRAAGPDPAALAALTPPTGGRLQKAAAHDPVLGPPAPAAAAPTDVPPDRRQRPGVAHAATKTKVGFLQDPDDTARARAAYEWTRLHEGHRSLSDFIAAAVMREVARLEAQYHDGDPWPGVEVGQIPTGKPLAARPVRTPHQP